MEKGAVALVYIGHGREEHSPDESISYFARRQITMPDEQGYPAFVPPFVYVGSKAAEKLFAKSGVRYLQSSGIDRHRRSLRITLTTPPHRA